ncbi:MAG: SNF2-related protein [Myxococcota bacterium]
MADSLDLTRDEAEQLMLILKDDLIELLMLEMDAPEDQPQTPTTFRREEVVKARPTSSDAEEAAPLPEYRKPSERTRANLEAMHILARQQETGDPITPAQRQILKSYTGWGGLSISNNQLKFPANFPVPDERGLIHEYYTPSRVARETVRVLLPYMQRLLQEQEAKYLRVLEPSAGIGRFVAAVSETPNMPAHTFSLVEISELSSLLLRALYPEHQVSNMPFERYVARLLRDINGFRLFDVILSNPPYGQRGAFLVEDPDSFYRVHQAYLYFMLRGVELLRPGGIAVFLVPYGFMSGRKYENWRTWMFQRVHLMAAYRLPSQGTKSNDPIFPGASLVVDLIFLRRRSGRLRETLSSDEVLIKGHYFDVNPVQVLGRILDDDAQYDPDDEEASRRFRRYTVVGDFSHLPELIERPIESGEVADETPILATSSRGTVHRDTTLAEDRLGDAERQAFELGKRLDAYLKARSSETSDLAVKLHAELMEALKAWAELHGNPRTNTDLYALAQLNEGVFIQRFLSVWTKSGALLPDIQTPPSFTPRFSGDRSDIVAMVSWLYRHQVHLSLEDVETALRRKLSDEEQTRLWMAGWCLDGSKLEPDRWSYLIPASDYYAGDMRGRLERAMRAEQLNRPRGKEQLLAIRAALKFAIWEDLTELSPFLPWLPLQALGAWLAWSTNLSTRTREPVALELKDGLLLLAEKSYQEMAEDASEASDNHSLSAEVIWFLGAFNNDMTLFKSGGILPPQSKEQQRYHRREVQTAQNLPADEIRLLWRKYFITSFQSWIESPDSKPHRELILERYNWTFKINLKEAENLEPLGIVRWNPEGPFLKSHQLIAAHWLLKHMRGILAFDVGVGKTFTAIASLAKARQEGWCRRPVIVCPNSIVWQWYRSIKRVLPDYRIGVVGARRKLYEPSLLESSVELLNPAALQQWTATYPRERTGRALLAQLSLGIPVKLSTLYDEQSIRSLKSVIKQLQREGYILVHGVAPKVTSRLDTKEQRAETYTKFQAGAYDVLLITETSFGRTRMNESALRAFASTTEAVLREVKLSQERARGKKPQYRSEREQAILKEGVNAWLTEQLAVPDDWEWDPGIAFDDLGIDMLIVDEAHAYKNLYLPEARELGVPKFLGNPGEGSKRSWNMAFRSKLVRQHNNGAGVILLTATPAKNSPLELYNLISYVDDDAFRKHYIRTPEQFIQMFCRLEQRNVINIQMEVETRQACTGFEYLTELKGVLGQYIHLRTAEEVGLELPEAQVHLIEVDMNVLQEVLYQKLVEEIEQILSNPDAGDRTTILGLLSRLQLVAIHPALQDGYKFENAGTLLARNAQEGVDHWTWTSPKLEAVVLRILMSRFQYDLLHQETQEGEPIVSAPISIRPGSLRLVAYGETMEDRTGAVLLEQWLPAQKKWSMLTELEFSGPFRLDLEPIQFPQQTVVRARVEDARRIVLVGNLSNEVEGLCSISGGDCACGHIVFCDNTAIHYWLRELLVSRGFPKERIGILNRVTAPNPADRTRMAQEFNGEAETGVPAKYDVLICNQVAYEGIDLQTRTCAIHHLDFPWEPATLQQRNGRGVRQGNQLSAIEINYYFSKRSLDGFRFNLIDGKRGWLINVFESQDRSTNNPAAQLELSPEDILVMISRNPEQTAERLAQVKARKKQESDKRLRDGGLSNMRAAIGLYRKTRGPRNTPEEATLARTMAEERLRAVQTIPPDIWPWVEHSSRVREQNLLLWREALLWEGQQFMGDQKTHSGFEVGQLQEAGFYFRVNDELAWYQWPEQEKFATEYAHLLHPKRLIEGSRAPKDEATVKQYILARLEYRRSWRSLNWTGAGESWLSTYWSQYGAFILQTMVNKSWQVVDQFIPVVENGKLVIWNSGLLRAFEAKRAHLGARALSDAFVDLQGDVLPPTQAGYERFLRLAVESEFKWSFLDQTALDWWGISIPRDLLSSNRPEKKSEVKTTEQAALRLPGRWR